MDPTEKQQDLEAPKYRPSEQGQSAVTDERKGSVQTLQANEVLRKAGIDGDEALKALEMEGGEVIVIDEETNRKLLRKIGI